MALTAKMRSQSSPGGFLDVLADQDAGVVKEHVQLAVGVHGRLHRRRPIGLAGDVQVHVGDVVAEFLQFGLGLLALVVQDVADDDAGALFREHPRLHCALPPRSAADERDFAFQPGHGDASCSWVVDARIFRCSDH